MSVSSPLPKRTHPKLPPETPSRTCPTAQPGKPGPRDHANADRAPRRLESPPSKTHPQIAQQPERVWPGAGRRWPSAALPAAGSSGASTSHTLGRPPRGPRPPAGLCPLRAEQRTQHGPRTAGVRSARSSPPRAGPPEERHRRPRLRAPLAALGPLGSPGPHAKKRLVPRTLFRGRPRDPAGHALPGHLYTSKSQVRIPAESNSPSREAPKDGILSGQRIVPHPSRGTCDVRVVKMTGARRERREVPGGGSRARIGNHADPIELRRLAAGIDLNRSASGSRIWGKRNASARSRGRALIAAPPPVPHPS